MLPWWAWELFSRDSSMSCGTRSPRTQKSKNDVQGSACCSLDEISGTQGRRHGGDHPGKNPKEDGTWMYVSRTFTTFVKRHASTKKQFKSVELSCKMVVNVGQMFLCG